MADRLLDFAADADLSDRLQQQWPDLPPDLYRQAQQLAPHQLAALLETLPQQPAE